MTYFCYIESSILSVPHMEALDATTRDDALVESVVLMAQHSSAVAVHVFLGEDRVGSVLASDASAPRAFSASREKAVV